MAVQGESAMTPTGLILCVVIVSIAIFVPGPHMVPLPPMAFVSCFLLVERRNDALKAIGYGLVVTGPIAIYLSVVWILIAGAAPVAGHSAVVYVANLCSRLLLFVVLLHAALKSYLTEGALRFLTEVKLPKPVKIMLAMTLAIASTIRASTEKAWVSLVTANLLTPRMSWRNARHGGLLVLTIWMSIVGTVSARLQTKWMIEDVPSRLDDFFSSHRESALTRQDLLWLGGAVATIGLSITGALQ